MANLPQLSAASDMDLIARVGAVALTSTLAMAQVQPVPAASSPAPTELAQRDDDKAFRMILQHSVRPRLSTAATTLEHAPTLAPVAVATPRSWRLEQMSSVEPEFPLRMVRQLGKKSVVISFDVRTDGTVSRSN